MRRRFRETNPIGVNPRPSVVWPVAVPLAALRLCERVGRFRETNPIGVNPRPSAVYPLAVPLAALRLCERAGRFRESKPNGGGPAVVVPSLPGCPGLPGEGGSGVSRGRVGSAVTPRVMRQFRESNPMQAGMGGKQPRLAGVPARLAPPGNGGFLRGRSAIMAQIPPFPAAGSGED